MTDPNDAASIPPEVRSEIRNVLDVEVRRVLAEHGLSLDLFGRLELLDLILDETEERFNAQLQPERSN